MKCHWEDLFWQLVKKTHRNVFLSTTTWLHDYYYHFQIDLPTLLPSHFSPRTIKSNRYGLTYTAEISPFVKYIECPCMMAILIAILTCASQWPTGPHLPVGPYGREKYTLFIVAKYICIKKEQTTARAHWAVIM